MATALSCAGTEGVGGSASPFESPSPAATGSSGSAARAEVERDLALRLRRSTTEGFEIGRDPKLEVVLENTSKTKTHHVVLPSDGSESNWREPYVFYTVERRDAPTSPWAPARAARFGRCGNYDHDWTKDVVPLEPGKALVLPWFGFFHAWDLDGASHVRVTAHYAYGEHARDLRKVPPPLHGTPAYALASNSIELAIDPAMTLAVTWKGALPRRNTPLANSVEVTATNHREAPIRFAGADTGGNLRLEIEGVDATGATVRHTVSSGVSVDDAKAELAPHASRDVVGAAMSRDDLDAPAGFRPKRVRAVLHVWWYVDEAKGTSDERHARSPWVEIP
ncbi:MAG: hypothetical protein JST00_40660 [Deltaproteobacteria bacterium]|nr:hypothetical protein [Deltaproteobacteria bacterium]